MGERMRQKNETADHPYYPDDKVKEIFISKSNAPTVDTEATSVKIKEPNTADKILI